MRGVRAVAKERLEPQAGDWAWNGKRKGKERVPGPRPLGQGLWYKVRSPRDERLCGISAPDSGSENSIPKPVWCMDTTLPTFTLLAF